ncbi:DUF4424 domain-containing protein [Pleomorphomonas sp. JP5]|uniref:DUF4424 domain-containing protein n=1 Tax=Pleomorphomonas sp. JP5 TaxID=2942998 RepID=UPI00204478FE|nr:DUF4424 domain-containing protein [Pleomorphomonas sp. JP5]MCM5556907.1 DUF4424 domain-containing protein [Pleomorphomonas sp. JP5]
MKKLPAFGMAAAFAGMPVMGYANDTMAELAAGGLTFVYAENVQMQSEDLYISPKEVRVDYVFHNDSDRDRTTVVAFPMPDIEGSGDFMVSVPNPESDNFMNFSVTIDDQPVTPEIDRHAFAVDVDVTELLKKHDIPLLPFGATTTDALAALPKQTIADWIERGIVIPMEYDDGGGWTTEYVPVWRLKTTYWWRTTFPAGRDLRVAHSYTPSVGITAGLAFIGPDENNPFAGEDFERERQRYCFDDGFIRAVAKRLDAAQTANSYLQESWISYVLTTGANWGGTIGRFHLTVDKGDTETLVSFCGNGVKKTGPTTFELTATDFYPERNIDIALIRRPRD